MAKGPGKRIDTWHIRPKQYEYSHEYVPIIVELRWEKNGTYHAEVDGHLYSSKDRDELYKEVQAAISETASVEWTRYIELIYEVKTCAASNFSDNHAYSHELQLNESREPDEDDDEPRILYQLALRWRIVEYSSAYKPPGVGHLVRLSRHVDADTMQPAKRIDQEKTDELPSGLIIYTPERVELLKRIRATFAMIDAKLIELFRGDVEDVGLKLDVLAHIDPSRLLAAPSEPAAIEPKAKRKRA